MRLKRFLILLSLIALLISGIAAPVSAVIESAEPPAPWSIQPTSTVF